MSDGATGSGYELLDCGGGERLERFAGVVVRRPAPAASFLPAWPRARWEEADLVYTGEHGWRGSAPEEWNIRLGAAVLRLRPGSGGQIGVFPEHLGVIARVEAILSRTTPPAGGWRILNLFAHTGLATLRLAALAGAGEIVHLDAAPSAIATARRNAEASGLARARIRWITDNAVTFLAREARRGRGYHFILADPPAFGRDRKSGGEWKLERDLPELLTLSRALANPDAFAFCLTCHKPEWNEKTLRAIVEKAMPGGAFVTGENILLRPLSGARALPCGCAAFKPFEA